MFKVIICCFSEWEAGRILSSPSLNPARCICAVLHKWQSAALCQIHNRQYAPGHHLIMADTLILRAVCTVRLGDHILERDAVVLLSRAAVVQPSMSRRVTCPQVQDSADAQHMAICAHVQGSQSETSYHACRFSCLVAVPSEVEKHKDPLGVVEVSAQCDHVGH